MEDEKKKWTKTTDEFIDEVEMLMRMQHICLPYAYTMMEALEGFQEDNMSEATIEEFEEDMASEPSTSASKENTSNEILLLKWHDSSTPSKDSKVNDYITPKSIPHGLFIHPSNDTDITYTQLSGLEHVDKQVHNLPHIQLQLSTINLTFTSVQPTVNDVIDDVIRYEYVCQVAL
ncbi:hypothetical protein Tco_1427156 [Tanacetum coccineum]